MKKYLLAFLFCSFGLSAQWTNLDLPVTPLLSAMTKCGDTLFLGATIPGGAGYLWVSGDNGDSWHYRPYYWFEYKKRWVDFTVSKLYSKGSNVYISSAQCGLLVSNDNGRTFNETTGGLQGLRTPALFFRDDTIFCYALNQTFKSINEGRSWNLIVPIDNNRITFNEYNVFMDNGILYGGNGFGCYTSNDYGKSWKQIFTSSTGMRLLELYNGVLYGRIDNKLYKSTNHGVSWNSLDKIVFNNLDGISSLKHIDNKIFICFNNRGLAIYDEQEDSIKFCTSLPYEYIYDIFKFDGSLFALTNGGGLYTSTDFGQSWNPKNTGLGDADLQINAVSYFDGKIFAATNKNTFSSSNNGATWGLDKKSTQSSNLERYYLANNDSILFDCGVNTIDKYSQSTKYWDYSAYNLNSINTFMLLADKYLFVCTKASAMLRYNIEDGTMYNYTWLTNGLQTQTGFLGTYSVVQSQDTLYTSTTDGLYRSIDWGTNWSKVVLTIANDKDFNHNYQLDNNLPTVKILKKYFDLFFAGTVNGMYKSADASNWVKCNSGIINDTVNCMEVYNGSILAGTSRGLYFSYDKGETWGIGYMTKSKPGILSLLIVGDTLIFTDGFNIQKRRIADIEVSVEENFVLYNKMNIFPNPSCDFIEISVEANGRSSLQSDVRIYNVFGQIQSTPVCSADTPASGGHVSIDVSCLAPGLYFVRIGEKVSKFVKL